MFKSKKSKLFIFFILSLFTFVTMTSSLAQAGYKINQTSHLIAVKYVSGGAWVTYPIAISHNYSVDYSNTSVGWDIEQYQGGVIYNKNVPAYYPFNQTIISAEVKLYKNYYNLSETWSDFSWEDGICEPNNWPWGYQSTTVRSLIANDNNKLAPSVVWLAAGTIPNIWTLDGPILYF